MNKFSRLFMSLSLFLSVFFLSVSSFAQDGYRAPVRGLVYRIPGFHFEIAAHTFYVGKPVRYVTDYRNQKQRAIEDHVNLRILNWGYQKQADFYPMNFSYRKKTDALILSGVAIHPQSNTKTYKSFSFPVKRFRQMPE